MKTIFPILFTLLINSFGLAQNENPTDSLVVAKIEMSQDENGISFIPRVQNRGALFLEYNYLLLVKKKDSKNNLSINKQSGRFTLSPGEFKKLSSVTINQTNEQDIKAILYIRDDLENRLITKDSIEIRPKNLSKKDETSLMMTGLVIDETKTKFGRDFYENFFNKYNQLPEKYDFIINIYELPYRATTSIIQIQVGQEVVYEFFSNLREDYLEAQVDLAMKQLVKYAADQANIQAQLKY